MNASEFLEKFDFYNQLDEQSKKQLDQQVQVNAQPGKKTIIYKGDVVSGVILVETGALRVYTISKKARESTLYWVEPGQSCILAINCVFADVLYPAYVDADKDFTRFAIIPADLYRKLYEREKSIQQFTFNVLASRIFDLINSMEEITSLSLEKRIANLILKKSSSENILSMNHETIASHLGSAREVITRTLKQFENQGFIETGRGYTRLIDSKGLRNILLE